MGRYDSAAEVVAYSDKRPDRCAPARGPEFVLPGETEGRRCGGAREVDRDMPPASDTPHWKRRVRRGFEEFKS